MCCAACHSTYLLIICRFRAAFTTVHHHYICLLRPLFPLLPFWLCLNILFILTYRDDVCSCTQPKNTFPYRDNISMDWNPDPNWTVQYQIKQHKGCVTRGSRALPSHSKPRTTNCNLISKQQLIRPYLIQTAWIQHRQLLLVGLLHSEWVL